METKRVNFRLPEDLIERADVAAAVTHKNRTELIREALQAYLADLDDEAFREAVVELYLDEEIGFDTLAEVIGTRDAQAVRSSKRLLDDGEELAGELASLAEE
jgi:metal-responsive CopG/Arc/MetJ family transcriptional regulator